eukprot:CAMPEP_0181043640 /NCGR_PEP_ID=MMETSP1070-20121207/12826_1 /TAXON_ID=265543 /ORGANISM="Minutocellus polymorphus, Strain NH13" /LENGTH=496 /DNA_ID=CAMNT_0023122003 /DNA_START=537 /DNA_END=2027 /DNA_ORIENTATION=+
MSLASQKKLGDEDDGDQNNKMTTFAQDDQGNNDDDKSVHTTGTGGIGSVRTNNSGAGMSSTACMSCESSLDPMFDDENLSSFDVLLYPPHNPFSDPEDQLLQFASETHPGNIRFLVLLDLHRPFYAAAVRNNDQAEIDRICDDIVEQICNGCVPPGTFKEWIVDEQEDDYGDLGDDTGAFGSEGGWDDLGTGRAARILVLRGLRNAPVTSEFDILPRGNLRRESMDSVGMIEAIEEIQTAAAAVTIAGGCSAGYLSDGADTGNEQDAAAAAAATVAKGAGGSKDKKGKKSFVKKMFGKKASKSAASLSESKSSTADIAAANAPPQPSAGDKRGRRHRSASDSESIRAYAKQTRRRRSSGLQAYSENDPLPKSDITRSDVLLHSSTRRCSNEGAGTDNLEKEDTLGLSKANRNRAGNRRMLSLIDMYRPSYEAVKSDQKKRASIVAEVAATIYRGSDEPGRFLKEDPETGMYREVHCERAMVTVEHLLCIADSKKSR